MQKFTELTAIAAPLNIENIDTDKIIPARFLKTIKRSGLGVSLLPEFVCLDALADSRVVELFPVAHLTPPEPWFACTRHGETPRSAVRTLLDALSASAFGSERRLSG